MKALILLFALLPSVALADDRFTELELARIELLNLKSEKVQRDFDQAFGSIFGPHNFNPKVDKIMADGTIVRPKASAIAPEKPKGWLDKLKQIASKK